MKQAATEELAELKAQVREWEIILDGLELDDPHRPYVEWQLKDAKEELRAAKGAA